MAKINYVEINDTIRYIENVAYLQALPVANADSEDFVSVNNVLYVKQINNGVYSYAEIGGSSSEEIPIQVLSGNDIEISGDYDDLFTDIPLEKLATSNVIIVEKSNGHRNIFYKQIQYENGSRGENYYIFQSIQYPVVDETFKYYNLRVDNIPMWNSKTVSIREYTAPTVSYVDNAVANAIKSITFSAPSTATQGTITSSDLATLQENDQNYIIFNDEIFRLNDKQHESGYLVYSHNGHDTTGCFFQKCITITISTLGWVLESQENASKTYVDDKISVVVNDDDTIDLIIN